MEAVVCEGSRGVSVKNVPDTHAERPKKGLPVVADASVDDYHALLLPGGGGRRRAARHQPRPGRPARLLRRRRGAIRPGAPPHARLNRRPGRRRWEQAVHGGGGPAGPAPHPTGRSAGAVASVRPPVRSVAQPRRMSPRPGTGSPRCAVPAWRGGRSPASRVGTRTTPPGADGPGRISGAVRPEGSDLHRARPRISRSSAPSKVCGTVPSAREGAPRAGRPFGWGRAAARPRARWYPGCRPPLERRSGEKVPCVGTSVSPATSCRGAEP